MTEQAERIIRDLEKLEDETSQLAREEARKYSNTEDNTLKTEYYLNYRAYEDAASAITHAEHFLHQTK